MRRRRHGRKDARRRRLFSFFFAIHFFLLASFFYRLDSHIFAPSFFTPMLIELSNVTRTPKVRRTISVRKKGAQNHLEPVHESAERIHNAQLSFDVDRITFTPSVIGLDWFSIKFLENCYNLVDNSAIIP